MAQALGEPPDSHTSRPRVLSGARGLDRPRIWWEGLRRPLHCVRWQTASRQRLSMVSPRSRAAHGSGGWCPRDVPPLCGRCSWGRWPRHNDASTSPRPAASSRDWDLLGLGLLLLWLGDTHLQHTIVVDGGDLLRRDVKADRQASVEAAVAALQPVVVLLRDLTLGLAL